MIKNYLLKWKLLSLCNSSSRDKTKVSSKFVVKSLPLVYRNACAHSFYIALSELKFQYIVENTVKITVNVVS